MSWTERMKEFGGGDLAFLSEDGEAIVFVVASDPVLLKGKYKGKVSEKIGCPIVTEDGYCLFVAGKRLARKISKHEGLFNTEAYIAVRHGEQGDIESTYDLKILDNPELTKKLFTLKKTEATKEAIADSIESALSVMKQ